MGRRGGKRRRRHNSAIPQTDGPNDGNGNNDQQEDGQAHNDTNTNNNNNKRPRVAALSSSASSSALENSETAKTTDGVDAAGSGYAKNNNNNNSIQITYYHNGEAQRDDNSNETFRKIPPPMTLLEPSNDEEGQDTKTNITFAASSSSSSSIPFCKIWNYLAKGSNNNNSNFSQPTKIQQHLWSIMKSDSSNDDGDIDTATTTTKQLNTIGIAPTGSGKTLAFGVPTILSQQSVLVLAPTRELVQQIAQVYIKLSKAFGKVILSSTSSSRPRVVTIFGGSDRAKQKKELLAAVHQKVPNAATIVVATPGRLLDLLSSSSPSTSTSTDDIASLFQPGWVVLDEADQLAKDDLAPQVDDIFKKLNVTSSSSSSSKNVRVALLSATYPEKVHGTLQKWVGDEYVLVEVDSISSSTTTDYKKRKNDTNDTATTGDDKEDADSNNIKRPNGTLLSSRIPPNLTQVLHVCSEHKKPRKLIHTLQTIKKQQTTRNSPLGIVFFGRIEKVKYVSKLLDKDGIANVQLHSQLSTRERQANLHSFSVGKRPLLLATDLAARGIDIPSVKFVIQYDFPGNLQQYVHRCGRAGRPSLHKKNKSISKNNNNEKDSAEEEEDVATVYSFFTRNLKAMASDMVQLLEANGAWVDPNLRSLINEAKQQQQKNDGTKTKKKKKNDKQQVIVKKTNNKKMAPTKSLNKPEQNQGKLNEDNGNEYDDKDGDDDDDFKDLAPNRIIFKRASNVSDASDSDSSDNDES